MNRISAAIAASRYLRDRYARAGIHNEYDVDPQPDADGSTQWVRPALISDRDQTRVPPPGNQHGPGRNPIQGDAA